MSDLDVSLRLRLVNQLSRPAEEAERDLKELQRTAEQLGRTRGGDQLGASLDKIGKNATEAKGKIGAIGGEADQLREKLGRLNNASGMSGLGTDADTAKRKIGEVGGEADQLRQKLGRLNDTRGLSGLKADADAAKRALETIGSGANDAKQKIEWLDAAPLDKLKGEAADAEAAIKQIGTAADNAQNKLKDLGARQPKNVPGMRPGDVAPPDPDARRRTGRVGAGVEGFVDRSGIDGVLPIGVGMGAGYVAGGIAGGAAVGVGHAYKRFAGDDRETEYIMMNMGVSEAEGAERRKQVRNIARDTRTPYSRTLEGLDALAATGLSVEKAMELLTPVMRTSLATGAEPADVANSAFQIMDKMKVDPKDIQLALDALVTGGNLGQFEVPAMAQALPGVLAQGATAGYSGLEGLRQLIAMLQTVMKDASEPSIAANNLQNLLFKYKSPETKANFKDAGVDLDAELAAGDAKGQDRITTLYNAVQKATGGDTDKIDTIFRDAEAYKAMVALVNQQQERRRMESELSVASGTAEGQWKRVSNDPQSSLDALSNATDRAAVALGGLADRLGMTREINNLAEGTEAFLDDPAKQLKLLMLGSAGNPLRDLWDKMFVGSAHAKERERDDSLTGYALTPGAGGIHAATGADEADMRRLKQQLGAPMDDAAQQSMDGYNSALETEGQEAVSIAGRIADSIRSMLGFTVSPTIQPRLVSPSAGGVSGGAGNGGAPRGVGGRQTASLAPVNNINIRTSNPQLAARRAQAEANRSVRLAQGNAIGDMGSAFG